MGRGVETYVDILRQQLVGDPVLLQDVVVNARTGQHAAKQEAKEPT